MKKLKIAFYKYHGTGNDFILIDNRTIAWKPTQPQVALLCDRHLGIGADGLMLLNELPGFDFGMTYYNSDGLESTMCGNGGRCITAFAESLGILKKKSHFMAIDGDHVATILSRHDHVTFVRLKMKDCSIGQEYPDGLFLDTGSPHFVKSVDNVQLFDVAANGRALRYDSRFMPGGTNVNFVEKTDRGIYVRTYERGVEAETLSCGTGVTASAIAFAHLTRSKVNRVAINTPGGVLTVSFCQNNDLFTNIWLEGPATFVFSGVIDLNPDTSAPLIFKPKR